MNKIEWHALKQLGELVIGWSQFVNWFREEFFKNEEQQKKSVQRVEIRFLLFRAIFVAVFVAV